MTDLASLLEWLYPDAPPGSWRVQQDNPQDGPYIAAWSVPGVEQPTNEYLASREADFRALARNWRERKRAAALAAGDGERELLLRAILKVIQGAIAQDRVYLAVLAAEVRKLGGTVPAAPGVRSFPELVAATTQAIRQGAGDPA